MRQSARQSLWEDALYDQKYDLAVIGGGLTGLSTAYFFKKKHPRAKVLVIDRGFFPIGASTRNAGFACIGTIGEFISDLEIDTEDQLKRRISDRYSGLKLLREVIGDEHLEYQHTGGYELFTDSDDFATVCSKIELFNNWMKELVGSEALFKKTEYRGYPAIFNPIEGMLHPGKMIQALIEMNSQLGVQFRWNTDVEELDHANGLIHAEQGVSIHSELLILTSNAFTQKILPDTSIKPGRGFVFVTSKIEDLKWKGTFHYDKGYVYFRNLGNDRLLIGGGRNADYQTEETDEFGVNESIKEYMTDFTNNIIKPPKGWQIEREWSGIMGFTETKSPILEFVSDNCVIAAGLSGMGVAMGMKLGESAANIFDY
ncbi:MAG: FAD-binding oxidoreductase [Balneola sp.]|nr:MAG: FAD-binding oxidoreductase [Balneola sp.]